MLAQKKNIYNNDLQDRKELIESINMGNYISLVSVYSALVFALGVVSVQIQGDEISYYDEVKNYFSYSQK